MTTIEWKQFDPTLLFPSSIQDALDSSGVIDLANTLGTALDAMSYAIDVASTFIGGFTDIHGALIQSVQDALWAVVQQLLETGIYSTFHMPRSQIATLPPLQFTYDLAMSLDDTFDPNRPILVDPSAYVGAIVICGTTNNYRDLIYQYRSMFETFKKKIADATQIGRWLTREDPWETHVGVGMAPNWSSIKLGEVVPPIGDLAREILSFSDTLTSAMAGQDIYESFAGILSEKADQLREFSEGILAILASIQSMLDWEGAFVLQVYGQGDAAWLQNILTTARGDLYEVENANFTAGAMFLATGGTTAPVDLLMDLFGLPKELMELVSG